MVNQMAVFMENREGRILKLTEILRENGIDLLTLSIADTKDFGILRCITRDNEKAMRVLKEGGFTVTSTELIGVEVSDTPGGLNNVLKILSEHNINVEYLYSFAHSSIKTAVILFKVNDDKAAIETLLAHNIKVLDKSII